MLTSALATLTAFAIAAQPCPTATVMRKGDVANCDGALVPTADLREVILIEGERDACRAELDGARQAQHVTVEGYEAEVAELERLLAEPPPFDWTALLIGAAVGLLAGGAVMYAVTTRN
jgi:hypothetical protein